MAAVCYAPVKSRVARLTRLDVCGAPVVGAKSSVSTGFIQVQHRPEYEDGDEYVVKDAWGDFCINEQDQPRLKRVGVQIDFCKVDPDVYDIASGARAILAAAGDTNIAATGATIGFAVDSTPSDSAFALEIWSKPAGAVCGASGTSIWIYTAYPFVANGRVGDLDFTNGTSTFTVSGTTKGAAATWINGPYEAGLKNVTTGEHIIQYLTEVAPPTAACGAIAVA